MTVAVLKNGHLWPNIAMMFLGMLVAGTLSALALFPKAAGADERSRENKASIESVRREMLTRADFEQRMSEFEKYMAALYARNHTIIPPQ